MSARARRRKPKRYELRLTRARVYLLCEALNLTIERLRWIQHNSDLAGQEPGIRAGKRANAMQSMLAELQQQHP